MPPDFRPDPGLLARYFAGETAPDETDAVRTWLAAHPDARLHLEGLATDDPAWAHHRDAAGAVQRLRHRMRPPRRMDRAPARSVTARRWAAVAAVGLVIVAGLWVARPSDEVVPSVPTAALLQVETAPGERRTVTLPDGSTVEVSVASRLRYPAGFGDGDRDVWLEGQAFFDVTPDAERPFRIHAGAATVEVLGTSFDVTAYDATAPVQVVVATGRVALGPATGGGRTTLAPGERGRLLEDGVAVETVDVPTYLGWRRGVLRFQGTPLPEVARTLERWYGVDVVLADPALASLRLDAAFHDEPIAQVVATLSLALDLMPRIDGATVTLAPNLETP